jgi:hypothetical protein
VDKVPVENILSKGYHRNTQNVIEQEGEKGINSSSAEGS